MLKYVCAAPTFGVICTYDSSHIFSLPGDVIAGISHCTTATYQYHLALQYNLCVMWHLLQSISKGSTTGQLCMYPSKWPAKGPRSRYSKAMMFTNLH